MSASAVGFLGGGGPMLVVMVRFFQTCGGDRWIGSGAAVQGVNDSVRVCEYQLTKISKESAFLREFEIFETI